MAALEAFFLNNFWSVMYLGVTVVWAVIIVGNTPLESLGVRLGCGTFYGVAALPVIDVLGAGPLQGYVPLLPFAIMGMAVAAMLMGGLARARLQRGTTVLLLLSMMPVLSLTLNGQPGTIRALFFPVVAAGVLFGGAWTLEQAIYHGRAVLRLYIWLSLAVAVWRPDLAFIDLQGRSTFGLAQLQGMTGHPNALGTAAVLLLVLELINLPRKRRWVTNPHLWVAAGTLLLTDSRGAYLALVVAVLMTLAAKRGWAVPAAIIGMAATALISLTSAGQHLAASVVVDLQNGRLAIWRTVLGVWKENPWFGAGDMTALPVLSNQADPGNAHNQAIQTLASNGIVGLVLLVAVLALMWRNAASAPIEVRPLMIALLAAYVARFIPETPLLFLAIRPNPTFALVVFTICLAAGSSRTTEDRMRQSRYQAGRGGVLVRDPELVGLHSGRSHGERM